MAAGKKRDREIIQLDDDDDDDGNSPSCSNSNYNPKKKLLELEPFDAYSKPQILDFDLNGIFDSNSIVFNYDDSSSDVFVDLDLSLGGIWSQTPNQQGKDDDVELLVNWIGQADVKTQPVKTTNKCLVAASKDDDEELMVDCMIFEEDKKMKPVTTTKNSLVAASKDDDVELLVDWLGQADVKTQPVKTTNKCMVAALKDDDEELMVDCMIVEEDKKIKPLVATKNSLVAASKDDDDDELLVDWRGQDYEKTMPVTTAKKSLVADSKDDGGELIVDCIGQEDKKAKPVTTTKKSLVAAPNDNNDELLVDWIGQEDKKTKPVTTKKCLLGGSKDDDDELLVDWRGQEEEEEKKKPVRPSKKSLVAALDPCLPEDIKNNYHVFFKDDAMYDAMLTRTKIEDNSNKFYVIQVLESNDGGSYMVYNRWGRVGSIGQIKLFGPYLSHYSATREFQLKFHAKTKNHWAARKKFVSHSKFHTWLEMDYSKMEQPDRGIAQFQPRKGRLDPRVASFISLICNIDMMTQQMTDIGYNAEKLPLKNLSKSMILKGYEVLKRICDVLSQSDRKLLEQLSGEFYTVIPHDFGYKKMCEFVIDTPEKLRKKLEMVEALGEIEVATTLLADNVGVEKDPLCAQYESLRCELIPVEAKSEEFSMIETYMKNTHGSTHYYYTVDIVQIFRVSRKGEKKRFEKYSGTKNRRLLWHGSRLTNWTGILSRGLRIAPQEAPMTGSMFGKGVYFADMFSKSANYCYPSPTTSAGVLLLCEVALGEMQELQQANPAANCLPPGKLSTKGVGLMEPDPSKSRVLEDGVVVPLGPTVQKTGRQALHYNEYIVYREDQIKMRYVIQVNFKFGKTR